MKKIEEKKYRAGSIAPTPYSDEALIVNLPLQIRTPIVTGPHRQGEIEESFEDNNDQKEEGEKQRAQEEFTRKAKTMVSNLVSGIKIRGRMSGHRDIVAKVIELAKLEKSYIVNMMNGRSADDPLLIRTKAVIESESAQLERMSGLKWPFR